MKVVRNILLGLFVCVLGVFIFSTIRVYMLNENNEKLKTEIDSLNKNSDKVTEDSNTKENELKEVKEASKDKIEEKETWEKAKEKLNAALA